MASEQTVETPQTGGSLEGRISKPDATSSGTPQASKAPTSWADEVASSTATDGAITGAASSAQAASIPQTDGAPSAMGGTDLHEPEYKVEVKLSDLQADPNNPLYSVKTFEELGLWVCLFLSVSYISKSNTRFLGTQLFSGV